MTGGISGNLPPTIFTTLKDIENLEAQGKRLEFRTPEERTQFLGLIEGAKADRARIGGQYNPVLAIPTPTNAVQLGLATEHLDQAIGNLPFSITDLLALLHELGQELKKTSKEARSLEQKLEVAALKNAANEIREGAKFAMIAGIVQGSMQIAGGVVSGIGAIRAGTTAAGKTQDLSSATNKLDMLKQKLFYTKDNQNLGAPDQVVTRGRSGAVTSPTQSNRGAPTTAYSQGQMQQAGTNASIVQSHWQAMSQILIGMGNVTGATLEFQGKEQEAQRAEQEALAKQIGHGAQSWDDFVKDMQSMMTDVRQKLADIQQSNNQVASRIWS